MTGGDHKNYCIIEIRQNPEKIPGDLRRFAFTQTSVKYSYEVVIKKTCQTVDFVVSVDHRLKIKESFKRDKHLDLASELKNKQTMEYGDDDRNCYRNNPERLGNGTRRHENLRSRVHPDYRIIRIGQNTEKSLRDLRKLAATQTPVKDQKLTLV